MSMDKLTFKLSPSSATNPPSSWTYWIVLIFPLSGPSMMATRSPALMQRVLRPPAHRQARSLCFSGRVSARFRRRLREPQ